MFWPLLSMGVAAPMLVPGAIVATLRRERDEGARTCRA